MSKRTIGLLAAALLVLITGVLSCSISQVLATRLSPTAVPTRTPRPTWTRQRAGLALATPTIDLTRYPDAQIAAQAPLPAQPANAPTPQIIVPGQQQPLVVPQVAPGQQVLTVVVVIVTATPVAPPSPTVGISTGPLAVSPAPVPGTPQPIATPVPGQPLPTPTVTNTPPPPVMVKVLQQGAFVRQGPGANYSPLTRLDKDTSITVVGRNRAGDWWKVCCVNGSDVWIADSVVKVDGPLWTVPEVLNIPPSPMPTPTIAPSPTPAPTPTFAWPFHVESKPVEYPLGQNIFRVSAVIYNGATPLYGYKLRIRKLSTGQEWYSVPSETYWKYEPIEWGKAAGTPQTMVKRNVKWDSNSVSIPMDNDTWEVTVTDGANNPLSMPVRFNTSQSDSKWYYVVFTGKP